LPLNTHSSSLCGYFGGVCRVRFPVTPKHRFGSSTGRIRIELDATVRHVVDPRVLYQHTQRHHRTDRPVVAPTVCLLLNSSLLIVTLGTNVPSPNRVFVRGGPGCYVLWLVLRVHGSCVLVHARLRCVEDGEVAALGVGSTFQVRVYDVSSL
jgi:hypothetical protein